MNMGTDENKTLQEGYNEFIRVKRIGRLSDKTILAYDDTVIYIYYTDYYYENLDMFQMPLLACFISNTYKDDFDVSLKFDIIPGDSGKTTFGFVGGKFLVARQFGTMSKALLKGYNIYRKAGSEIATPLTDITTTTHIDIKYKFCPKCGTKLTIDTAFCGSCGTALS